MWDSHFRTQRTLDYSLGPGHRFLISLRNGTTPSCTGLDTNTDPFQKKIANVVAVQLSTTGGGRDSVSIHSRTRTPTHPIISDLTVKSFVFRYELPHTPPLRNGQSNSTTMTTTTTIIKVIIRASIQVRREGTGAMMNGSGGKEKRPGRMRRPNQRVGENAGARSRQFAGTSW